MLMTERLDLITGWWNFVKVAYGIMNRKAELWRLFCEFFVWVKRDGGLR